MRLSQVIRAWFSFQCRSCCVFSRPTYLGSCNIAPFQGISFYHKQNVHEHMSMLVKEVRLKLPYSTKPSTDSQNVEGLESAKSKKKKEIKVYITLLGADGNIISVTTVEEATKLAQRRNMRLVKEVDLDPKTGRAAYKLMTESDYLKDDKDWDHSKTKKEKSIRGDKVVSFTSSTAEHDVLTKVKMMQKWLEKRFEVRVVITGDLKNGENVFKLIEQEIGTNGRIVQKRSKGQDIRFQILPPKKTEPSKNTEAPPQKKEQSKKTELHKETEPLLKTGITQEGKQETT